jgi:tRNA (adenine-N(1)-)-methyltransferase non-catalytic subunit
LNIAHNFSTFAALSAIFPQQARASNYFRFFFFFFAKNFTRNFTTMEEGQRVLLQMPDGYLKSALIQRGSTVTLGRYGTVVMEHLIGKPFGLSFEILPDRTLRTLSRQELARHSVADVENSAGLNNQEIFDTNASQKLTAEEIVNIRQQDESGGMRVVEALIENNSAFQKRTELSKAKYIERKKEK